METARIGVFLDKYVVEYKWNYGMNVFEKYMGEILAHAGISFEWIDEAHQISRQMFDIVLIGIAKEDEPTGELIWKYVESGGMVISFAGLNVLAKRLGFMKSKLTGVGYARVKSKDDQPNRFLNAVPWQRKEQSDIPCSEFGEIVANPHSSERISAAMQMFRIGNGTLHRWSVDIINTIVGLQQGTKPVWEDGIPDPAGMGQVDEGILKADDQVEMDWEWDRAETNTGRKYFAYPYADFWREAVIENMFRLLCEHGKTVPFIGYWPQGIEGVCMISHDSDRNIDEHAETTLQVLRECGIHSTWCMMMSGYSAHLYPKIKAEGHELAFHFNGKMDEGGAWNKEEFSRQFSWLKNAVNDQVVSNKNHFTRFEGWGDIFEWCEDKNIASDQTRGPSKKGNVGFLFGTCHPYFPIAWSNERNRMYDVLEVGFLTQDIPHWTDLSVVAPFLNEVKKVKGVAHFLFHQGRIHRSEEVQNALRTVVDEARKLGFAFWTGQQINDWERARRKIKIKGIDPQDRVIMDSEISMYEAVIWRTVLKNEAIKQDETVEERFGVTCKRINTSDLK